jgi:hypothetical protein
LLLIDDVSQQFAMIVLIGWRAKIETHTIPNPLQVFVIEPVYGKPFYIHQTATLFQLLGNALKFFSETVEWKISFYGQISPGKPAAPQSFKGCFKLSNIITRKLELPAQI